MEEDSISGRVIIRQSLSNQTDFLTVGLINLKILNGGGVLEGVLEESIGGRIESESA